MVRTRLALVLLTALAAAGCSSDGDTTPPGVDEPCDFSSGPRDCPPTTFFCTGEPQTYTVPAGVYGILVDVRGAYGWGPGNTESQVLGGLGGPGGRVITPLQVSPGDELRIDVGCASFGRDGGWGHGSGGKGGTGGRWGVDGGGGGGSSAIVSADGEVLVVAGGGGGGGGNENDGNGPTGPQLGTWGGGGGFGTAPATAGAPGQCNGVGCAIAEGGCANCSGVLDGGDGDSLSDASDFGGGGGGGGGGYDGGNGGQHATTDLLGEGSVAGNNPCQGTCPIDVGEAGGGGGGQSYAIDPGAAIFLPNVYGLNGEVIIHTTAAVPQLFTCTPNESAAQLEVPAGATRFDIELVGGSGHTPDWGNKYRPVDANGQGGFGGLITGTIPVGGDGVQVGDTLVVLAGCQGQGDGGFGWGSGGRHGRSSDETGQDGGGGGGGSTIGYGELAQPLAVAGGGGGGGGSEVGAGGAGGDGGPAGSTDGNPGGGADGGDGGCEGCNDPSKPFDGTRGEDVDLGGGGGGGGGGWPGGGGGHAGSGGGGGGGAGGVSAVDASYTANVNVVISNATGDGYVLLFGYPAPPASIVVVSGSDQRTALGAAFAQPLVARVTDVLDVPVAGVSVNFNLSGTGAASGVFPDGTQNMSVATDSNGIATSAPVTAAVMTGTWQAGAFVRGLDPAVFSLTNGVPTTTALSVSPQPVTPNQITSVTATVTAADAGITPTGDITITVQGAPFVYPLVDGKAVVQLDPGDLELGTSTIEAHYPGDGTVAGSSASLPLDVVATPTSMRLSSSLNPSGPDEAVVFTATITVPAGTAPCSGCTVMFYVDDTFLDTVEVGADWQASSPPTGLAAGAHTVRAEFFGGTYASTSATLMQSVGFTLRLETSAIPAQYGADLALIAEFDVPPGATAPTGTVTFETDSGAVYCADVPLTGIRAGCDLGNALAAGSYDFVARYSGDANYPAASTSLQLPVQPTRTTVTIHAPARIDETDQPFDMSVTVARVEPGTLPLSGTVQFTADGLPLGGPAPIDASGSTGPLSTSLLAGTHEITATYSGTPAGYLGSEGRTSIDIVASDS